ncbi:hypothetical protein MUK42_13458 [Musa troglodytarum]|uniref:Uncharacterized protein n=1 Tax=Musa troglodytarum TaxID=320322 RepID=A0A9E7KA83_9LILI|nr:hypothetical protein MUK42_13458 [Musa troglodytarum]
MYKNAWNSLPPKPFYITHCTASSEFDSNPLPFPPSVPGKRLDLRSRCVARIVTVEEEVEMEAGGVGAIPSSPIRIKITSWNPVKDILAMVAEDSKS